MAYEQGKEVRVDNRAVIPAVKRIGVGKPVAVIKHLPRIGCIVELIVLDFPVVDIAGRGCQPGNAHDRNRNQGNEQSQEINLFRHAFEEKQLTPFRVQGAGKIIMNCEL